jgi:hypothetical protein
MVAGRTTVILPSRMEPYLKPTVEDVLKHATGDLEVIACLDGWWPNPPLMDDPRVRVLHWGEAKGLRPSINAAVAMSTGEFLFKLDAHCAVCPGFDTILQAACGETDIVVPAKYSLNVETWERFREPWEYFFLMWPWQIQDDGTIKFVGLQDKNYDADFNAPRASQRIDDILSYQGSAWMIRRSYFDRLLPEGMDHAHYYYAQEPQEVGLKAWLTGGRARIVKDAWYAHLHKGKGEHKRQFKRLRDPWNEATIWSAKYWMAQPGFPALIERFGPLPGWPENWQAEAEVQWSRM